MWREIHMDEEHNAESKATCNELDIIKILKKSKNWLGRTLLESGGITN